VLRLCGGYELGYARLLALLKLSDHVLAACKVLDGFPRIVFVGPPNPLHIELSEAFAEALANDFFRIIDVLAGRRVEGARRCAHLPAPSGFGGGGGAPFFRFLLGGPRLPMRSPSQ
jgi:hypothetical protein